MAAVLRVDVGPTGYDGDFLDFDLLLFMNLGDADLTNLTNPLLGVDPLGLDDTFLHELLLGGYTRPLPEVLAELGPYAIYATLIPEWAGLFNARIDGAQALTGAQLRNGDVAYLTVPEPTTALLPAWGLVLLTGWRRRQYSWSEYLSADCRAAARKIRQVPPVPRRSSRVHDRTRLEWSSITTCKYALVPASNLMIVTSK